MLIRINLVIYQLKLQQVNWSKEVKPQLYFSHRLNTKHIQICFIKAIVCINLFAYNFQRSSGKVSSQHILGFICIGILFLWNSTHFTRCPVSFLIVNFGKRMDTYNKYMEGSGSATIK